MTRPRFALKIVLPALVRLNAQTEDGRIVGRASLPDIFAYSWDISESSR